MKPDWTNILERLNRYPENIHRLLPRCPEERLSAAQAELGKMPDALVEMLIHFNGARLFKKTGPLVSIFGISTIPPLPPLQWAKDWYIDKFTPTWRLGEGDRQKQWVIAMMNYGDLVILEDEGTIKLWSTAQKKWELETWGFDEWVENVLTDGDLYLREQ